MKLKQYYSFLLILFIAALGGGAPVLIKTGLEETSALNFTFWRFLSAVLVLLPVLYIQKHKLSFRGFKKLFWIILFGSGNILIFLLGIKLTTASAAQVIYIFTPLLAGFLSYFILGEKINSKKVVGVTLGFIGTLLIILLPVIAGDSKIEGNIIGNLLVLLAVSSHSMYTVLSKNKQKDFSPIEITVYTAISVIFFSLLLMPIERSGLFLPTVNVLFPILYTGIAGTALFYLLYQYVIKIASPLIASTVLYLQAGFTFIWAIFLLGEKITPALIAGMALVFAGVYVASVQTKNNQVSFERQK